ncbi:MAG: helix-turn-helix domain-containing protein, partial [Sarcina sp.]
MEILSLGEKIKRRRKELNMTLKDLAQDRITPGQISLVESGRSNPSMDLLEYLAETLKTSVEYLMETEKTQAERICLYFEQLAEKAILDGNQEKVDKYIEYALHYAEQYNLEYRKARNLYLRAEQNLRRENLTEAQENYISANILFVKTGSYLDVVKTYLNIGKISLKLKAYHSANSYLREAEKFYREYDLCEDYLLGEIYYFLSKSYYFIEDTQKAINFSYLAKKEFEKIYDRKKYAESLELLAEEYGKIGDMDNALRFSEKSLNI